MDYIIETIRYLLTGARVSTMIFVVTLIFSIPLSIILVILYRENKLLRYVINLYTWLFRGTPLMLQLFFFMYGLPALGIMVDRMMVAYIAFIINYTAYFVEIMRAGVESINKDQLESASVEGASTLQAYRHILMPQAIRVQIPTITNEVITLIKDTSLVTVIAISDIMRNVREIVSRDFTISPFVVAAIFYLLFSYIIVKFFKAVERKYSFIDN